MSREIWPQRVLLLYEGVNFGGDFDYSFVNGFKAHGCEVTCVQRGNPWSPPFDLVLGYGPFTLEQGSILPIAKQLLALPVQERPIFVWWLTENSPNPRLPDWFVQSFSKLRLKVDDILRDGRLLGQSFLRDPAMKGHRLRIFGQLGWARDKGVLDVLAITSSLRAEYYRQRGFSPIVVPLGYDPVYGSDLGLERDIDVAFLGSMASARREKLLPGLLDAFAERGIEVKVEDFLYGEERIAFLNRTRILINVLREPQDFVGQRYLLAAANKVLVVSEPVIDHTPFDPGQHMVATSLDKIVDTAAFYLTNERKRQEVVDRAYRFVTEELTIAQMVGLIIDQARLVRQSKRLPANGVLG